MYFLSNKVNLCKRLRNKPKLELIKKCVCICTYLSLNELTALGNL